MTPTLLYLRMEALAHHLANVMNPTGWLDTLDLKRRPDENLWLEAVKGIAREADELLGRLQDEMEALHDGADQQPDPELEARAWELYRMTLAKSEEIFRECMELLGGIALRDRLTEEFVWSFADELISECAEFVGQPTSFAIPASESPFSSTLRRVARVSFPDWHVWALPLVAYEYGHVVLRETSLHNMITELAIQDTSEQVKRLVGAISDTLPTIEGANQRHVVAATLEGINADAEDVTDKLAPLADLMVSLQERKNADLVRATMGTIKDLRQEAEQRISVLAADVFATFSTGPAYACAAMVLRLNPACPRQPGRPSDAERAATILQALADMTTGPGSHFVAVKERLATEWASLMDRSRADDARPEDDDLEIDVSRVLTRIRQRMLKPREAEYMSDEWAQAKVKGSEWLMGIQEKVDLNPDFPGARPRLRDVLNAAWHCRLEIMHSADEKDIVPSIERLTETAVTACENTVSDRRSKGRRPAFGGGQAERPAQAG